jgi:hypothetical protein
MLGVAVVAEKVSWVARVVVFSNNGSTAVLMTLMVPCLRSIAEAAAASAAAATEVAAAATAEMAAVSEGSPAAAGLAAGMLAPQDRVKLPALGPLTTYRRRAASCRTAAAVWVWICRLLLLLRLQLLMVQQ